VHIIKLTETREITPGIGSAVARGFARVCSADVPPGAIGGLAVCFAVLSRTMYQASKVLICINVNIYRNSSYVLSLTKY
jgi:hypothetical protein